MLEGDVAADGVLLAQGIAVAIGCAEAAVGAAVRVGVGVSVQSVTERQSEPHFTKLFHRLLRWHTISAVLASTLKQYHVSISVAPTVLIESRV